MIVTMISVFLRLFKVTAPSDEVAVTEPARANLKMDRALLCLDCETLFEAEGPQRCPSCGSMVAWAVSRALNRTQQPYITYTEESHDD